MIVCPDGTAGSLHAYWSYLTGGMLYKDYAHMEDPAVSLGHIRRRSPIFQSHADVRRLSDRNRRFPCLGDGRGGESAEGSWYQYSMYRLALAMASIESAGYNDPIAYGPQMSLATSSWWDMKAVSDLEFLTYGYAKLRQNRSRGWPISLRAIRCSYSAHHRISMQKPG